MAPYNIMLWYIKIWDILFWQLEMTELKRGFKYLNYQRNACWGVMLYCNNGFEQSQR